MNSIEQKLLQALNDLDAAVKSISASGAKPDLAAHFKRIDSLSEKLPRETSPDLLHYLQRKSYEKARLFLAGRYSEIARGGCRR